MFCRNFSRLSSLSNNIQYITIAAPNKSFLKQKEDGSREGRGERGDAGKIRQSHPFIMRFLVQRQKIAQKYVKIVEFFAVPDFLFMSIESCKMDLFVSSHMRGSQYFMLWFVPCSIIFCGIFSRDGGDPISLGLEMFT